MGAKRFEGLASQALLESEFERLVAQSAEVIFPGLRLVSFRCDVESEFGCKRPDYALVDHDYRAWWVVEVEMAHHSLEGHVLPQVDVFRSGRYGPDHADAIARQAPNLDRDSLMVMMSGAPPQVVVVVNLPCTDWVLPLRERDALLTVVEVFRSDLDEYALRVNGDVPLIPGDVLTRCRRIEMLPRLLVVDSPAALGGGNGDRFEIDCGGLEAEWMRLDLADRVCLTPSKGGDPLPGIRSVDLTRLGDGRLAFRNARRA